MAYAWEKIDHYLRGRGIRIGYPSLGQTTGGGHVSGSLHFRGQARDYGTANSDCAAIARALEPFARGPNCIIIELFYSGTQTWYDSGQYFVPGHSSIEYANHFSHVHAGIRAGASLPGSGPGPSPIPLPEEPVNQTDINNIAKAVYSLIGPNAPGYDLGDLTNNVIHQVNDHVDAKMNEQFLKLVAELTKVIDAKL